MTLEVKDASASYGKFEVLWNVSLEVGDEIVTLIGPNGHGKTSILNMISGIIPPHTGCINYNGERIDGRPPHEIVRAGITHVPQGGRLFPLMTVIENLKLGAYKGGAWQNREKNLRRVYDLFPRLEERKKQVAWTLSGGEKRMLSIGRGLMSDATLLLVDEPSLGLAPHVQLELVRKIKEIRGMNISLLMAEQNVKFVKDLADRVYLVEGGKIALEGRTQEVLTSKFLKEAYLPTGEARTSA